MFGIGTTEILIILVIALFVIGPKKLPEMARTLGKGFAEFKRMSNDVKRTIEHEAERLEQEDRQSKVKQKLYGDKETKTEEATGDEKPGTEDTAASNDEPQEPDAPESKQAASQSKPESQEKGTA